MAASRSGTIVLVVSDVGTQVRRRNVGSRNVESRRPESRRPEPDPCGSGLSGAARQHGDRFEAECAARDCVHWRQVTQTRRDLHDQVGASLVGLAMQLEVVQRLVTRDSEAADRLLADVRADVAALVGDVRRLVSGRDPRSRRFCDDIAAGLRGMIGRMNAVVGDRLHISLELDDAVSAVRGTTGDTAFLIVREALTNVLKHSEASHCRVSLAVRGNELQIVVEDDGTAAAVPRSTGSGLTNMTERAAELGGWCRIRPLRPHGFLVLASLPYPTSSR